MIRTTNLDLFAVIPVADYMVTLERVDYPASR